MTYSIDVDWSKDYENWENVGRDAIVNNCNHHTQDKDNTNMEYSEWCEECDCGEDTAQPMMNYAYPLDIDPSEEDILKVVKDTCCSVMYNTESEKYFIVLCGGGMDLSQDIALAYVYLQNRIPASLLSQVYSSPLSIRGKRYSVLVKHILEQIGRDKKGLNSLKLKWEDEEEQHSKKEIGGIKV